MKSKAFVSLLVTFFVSIPVATQQPQPQKPKTTAEKETQTVPKPQQPQTEEDQDSVVRITTNLVQVDAVVTKDGRVVTDLTPNDFVLTEDGRPQTITHFSYVSNVPNAEQPVATSTPLTTNTSVILPAVVRRDEIRRTIAIVVDDLGISLDSIRGQRAVKEVC